MKIWVNGEIYEVQQSKTVQDLMSELNMEGKPVVVEWNGEALLMEEWELSVLGEGDRIEIVVLVAGG